MMRKFHTVLSRPVDLFSSNVIVYSGIEALSLVASVTGWPLCIGFSSAAVRVLSIPVSSYLDRLTWKPPKFLEEPLEKAHKSFLVNDLEHDVKSLKLTSSDFDTLKLKISASVLMRQAIQSYFLLGFLRALNQVSLNPQYYEGLNQKFWGIWSLGESDPFFFAPIVAGAFTYKVFKGSFHPLTIKLKEPIIFWLSFGASIAFIPAPISYVIAYSSFSLAHIIIRKIKR